MRGFLKLIDIELIFSGILTLISYGLYFYQSYLIAHSLRIDVEYLSFSLIIALALIIGFIPVTIAGLGTREAALIFLFQYIGQAAETALGFAVLYNVVYIICAGLIGFAAWWAIPLKMETIFSVVKYGPDKGPEQ